ncbi:MAG TPA: proton-conducting transporter membrane subunit, partial [Bacteroidia bacterium]|nr:proton-conducting transporter membrane subunit [Bacteroidia bacterium]
MNELLAIMKQELLLTGTLLLVLVLKLAGMPSSNNKWNGWMQFLLLANLIGGWIGNVSGNLFGDMYVTDPSLVLQKNLLLLATLVIVSLSTTWLERHRHLPEFYLLLLSTLLGMFWMISSRNLLMFYLSLELATIPLAAMVNFDLGKRISSEAAMKMVLSSALASGLLLFGVSLIYGATGTLSISEAYQGGTSEPILTMGFLFFLSGFFFKLSVVPFQFWTP